MLDKPVSILFTVLKDDYPWMDEFKTLSLDLVELTLDNRDSMLEDLLNRIGVENV